MNASPNERYDAFWSQRPGWRHAACSHLRNNSTLLRGRAAFCSPKPNNNPNHACMDIMIGAWRQYIRYLFTVCYKCRPTLFIRLDICWLALLDYKRSSRAARAGVPERRPVTAARRSADHVAKQPTTWLNTVSHGWPPHCPFTCLLGPGGDWHREPKKHCQGHAVYERIFHHCCLHSI